MFQKCFCVNRKTKTGKNVTTKVLRIWTEGLRLVSLMINWAVVVVAEWSACSPTLTIRVRILPKHNFFAYLCLKKNENKPKRGRVGPLKKTYVGSGCGSVGRAVVSDTRGPRFKSSLRQKFIYILNICLLSTVC